MSNTPPADGREWYQVEGRSPDDRDDWQPFRGLPSFPSLEEVLIYANYCRIRGIEVRVVRVSDGRVMA